MEESPSTRLQPILGNISVSDGSGGSGGGFSLMACFNASAFEQVSSNTSQILKEPLLS